MLSLYSKESSYAGIIDKTTVHLSASIPVVVGVFCRDMLPECIALARQGGPLAWCKRC